MPKINGIKIELSISNCDDILSTAKRLSEISNELVVIGYKLKGKLEIKEKSAPSTN